MVFRVCSGDGVTGDGGDGYVTSDKIFTGVVTGDAMVTGEAYFNRRNLSIHTADASNSALHIYFCTRLSSSTLPV